MAIKTALIAGAVLAASITGLATAQTAAAQGSDLTVSSSVHYGPATGKATGIDFTVCNNRSFPAPTQTDNVDNDFGSVSVSIDGGSTGDPTSFELGAPRRTIQHCGTILVYTSGTAHLSATISYARGGSASASASDTVPQPKPTHRRASAHAARQAPAQAQQPAPVLNAPATIVAHPTAAPEVLSPAPEVSHAVPTADPSNPAKQRAYVEYLNTHAAAAPETTQNQAITYTPTHGWHGPTLLLIAALVLIVVCVAGAAYLFCSKPRSAKHRSR
jgi:hypothetical protein